MMTSSGARQPARPDAQGAQRDDLAAAVEHRRRASSSTTSKLYALIGSPAYPSPPIYLRERFATSVRRSYRPAGTARQMVAIAADGDRSPLLGAIRMPTQIIHGTADPLVPVAAGHDLKAKIPAAPRST